jgi:hypothetical protein
MQQHSVIVWELKPGREREREREREGEGERERDGFRIFPSSDSQIL